MTRFLAIVLCCVLPACTRIQPAPVADAVVAPVVDAGSAEPASEALQPIEFMLQSVATGLNDPVDIKAAPGDSRLFIVERYGRILVYKDGEILGTPFLDWSSKVQTGFNEQGLLAVAFHPDFVSNGRFFIYYTEKAFGEVHIAELKTGADGNADPKSEKVLVKAPQFAINHNGGSLLFGPDGKLYAGLGDGGMAGDPRGNGQKTKTILAGIIRLDVDGVDLIPDDNPFIDTKDARGELWVQGLRNPWRFSFDRGTGDLWIGDVGQNKWEIIHYLPAGEGKVPKGGVNFGWNVVEGFECFRTKSCDTSAFTRPVTVYPHAEGNCSVTGGYVYRGQGIPSLQGWYLFADFCTGMLRAARHESDNKLKDIELSKIIGGRSALSQISTFGEDNEGEIYVALLSGAVSKLVAKR